MANLSDADVTITVSKVGREFYDYLVATQKTSTDYAIVYDIPELSDVVDGDFAMHSSSSGRWSYATNLEGYFAPDTVKHWLGVESGFYYVAEEKRAAMKEVADEQYAAYLKLVEAIELTGGSVTIDYTDSDMATEWIGEGFSALKMIDGEIEYIHDFEGLEWSIENVAKHQYMDDGEALQYVYDEETARAFEKRTDKNVSADEWLKTYKEK